MKEMVKMKEVFIKIILTIWNVFIVGLASLAFSIGLKVVVSFIKMIFGKKVDKIDIYGLIETKANKEKGKFIWTKKA